jgi:hypothetical protein
MAYLQVDSDDHEISMQNIKTYSVTPLKKSALSKCTKFYLSYFRRSRNKKLRKPLIIMSARPSQGCLITLMSSEGRNV